MSLRVRLAIVLVVLGISAVFYAVERSLEHFLWHVGYGASFGILVAAAVASTGRHASPYWYALASYAYMVVPDLIWLTGRIVRGAPFEHAPWMDVFLLHVSLDQWALATPLVLPTYIGACLLVGLTKRRSNPRPTTQPS